MRAFMLRAWLEVKLQPVLLIGVALVLGGVYLGLPSDPFAAVYLSSFGLGLTMVWTLAHLINANEPHLALIIASPLSRRQYVLGYYTIFAASIASFVLTELILYTLSSWIQGWTPQLGTGLMISLFITTLSVLCAELLLPAMLGFGPRLGIIGLISIAIVCAGLFTLATTSLPGFEDFFQPLTRPQLQLDQRTTISLLQPVLAICLMPISIVASIMLFRRREIH